MPGTPKYSEEELLDEIRRLAEERGKAPPTKNNMDEYGAHYAKTYQHRFGSWSAAVEKAGFEPRSSGVEHYRSRPDSCPLCGSEGTGFDFHHWRYGEDEMGCYLCRECHDDIHEGKGNTTNPDWLVHAVENLVNKHSRHHLGESYLEEILEKYNMPDIGPLVERFLD